MNVASLHASAATGQPALRERKTNATASASFRKIGSPVRGTSTRSILDMPTSVVNLQPCLRATSAVVDDQVVIAVLAAVDFVAFGGVATAVLVAVAFVTFVGDATAVLVVGVAAVGGNGVAAVTGFLSACFVNRYRRMLTDLTVRLVRTLISASDR